MIAVKKQSLTSYTVENGSKVVGWIRKVSLGYNVSLRDSLMDRYSDDHFVSSFKEAKEYALMWCEGGEWDSKN